MGRPARGRAGGQGGWTSRRLCMVEDIAFVDAPADLVRRRFDLYRQLGFGTLRTSIAWRHVETSPGLWTGAAHLQGYLSHAVAHGFRLKMGVETLGAPPPWFLRAHPDAAIRNADGETSGNDLSLWYPGLRAVLADKATMLFGRLAQFGILANLDWVFADLGPASEPIYPAAWTQGKASCREATPWFYGAHARDDFAATMARRYAGTDVANARWRTGLRDWGELELPPRGAGRDALWTDALEWYRDSKRDVVAWQVGNYQRALAACVPAPGREPRLVIMVPGRHIEAAQWTRATQAGAPDCALTVMTDSEYLLGLARDTGCALQYTADENGDELAWLRSAMARQRNRQPLWGENVGVPAVAGNPGHIADAVIAAGLDGMDYVRSSRIFESDGITPNPVFDRLAAACQQLRASWG